MYSFSIEKGHIPLVKVMVVDEIVENDAYLKGLIEKCFERVFSMIRKEDRKEKDSSEEADLEDED